MRRPRDEIVVETNAGRCLLAQSVRLSQGFDEMAQLSLSAGDDRAWAQITRIFHPGQDARLFLNGQLQFTGRWEVNDVPATTSGGVTAELIARPRSADARYCTAQPNTALVRDAEGDLSFNNVTLRAFILALFTPLGYTEADFQLDATADRNLITGQRTGAPKLVDLEPIQEGRAKVQPGETVWDALQRHLKRFHLMAWDGADGRIVIGKPDDQQAPLTWLRAKRGAASHLNNVISAHRIRDYSEVVSEVRVTGYVDNDDGDPRAIFGAAGDAEVLAVAAATDHFRRRLVIPLEQVRAQGRAEAQARRELGLRSKNKDAWEIGVDDWTHWNGQRAIPWAFNTTTDVDVDTIGVDGAGRYLIRHVNRTLDVMGGGSTSLTLVAPGVLSLGG